MKHTFRTLLGLSLMVFILAGCSSPVGSEFSEVPEDNVRSVKVEFEYRLLDKEINAYAPQFLLDLHFDSELNSYAYGLPEDLDSYIELYNDKESFKKFFEDAFEQVFSTKECKEGEVIDLKKWTSKAARVSSDGKTKIPAIDCLQFSLKDSEKPDVQDCFDEIIVGNEDILVYVFFDFNKND